LVSYLGLMDFSRTCQFTDRRFADKRVRGKVGQFADKLFEVTALPVSSSQAEIVKS